MPGTDWWALIGHTSDVIGVFGAFSALFAAVRLGVQWRDNKRLNQTMSVEVQCAKTQQVIKPELVLRRKYTTRAEVQGVLGTIKMKEPKTRYALDYMNSKIFGDAIASLQDPKQQGLEHNTLVIPCSPSEIEQFDECTVKPLYESHEQE